MSGKGRRPRRSQAAGLLILLALVFLFVRSRPTSSALTIKTVPSSSHPGSREKRVGHLETQPKTRSARSGKRGGEYHGDDDDYITGLEGDAESFRRRSSVANPHGVKPSGADGDGDGALRDDGGANDYDLEEKLGADAEDFTQDSSMPSKDAESAGEMAAAAEAAAAAALPSSEPAAPQGSPFLEALAACEDLACLKEAHALPRGGARYNFPHFLIIGFQKTATTSLYGHLADHPAILKPSGKEPEFLSSGCQYAPPEGCPGWASKRYIRTTLRLPEYVESGGAVAPFEASTHIVRSGDLLAPRLAAAMPWVRLVISMREPISRAASMLIHLKDHSRSGCLVRKKLGDCLLEESQINGAPSGARTTNYSFPVATWLEAFPPEQVHVIQYEELTEEERQGPELDRLKGFLGVAPGVPARPLGVHNSRKDKIRPEGWRMRREQYEALIELVRPDVEALLAVLGAAGKVVDARAWVARWEAVWQENLESCDEEGWCNILLS